MSKIAIISAALVSVGFGVQMAVEEAERLAAKANLEGENEAHGEGASARMRPAKLKPRTKAPIIVPAITEAEKVFAFARQRKGREWNAEVCALATGVKRANVYQYVSTSHNNGGPVERISTGRYRLRSTAK